MENKTITSATKNAGGYLAISYAIVEIITYIKPGLAEISGAMLVVINLLAVVIKKLIEKYL